MNKMKSAKFDEEFIKNLIKQKEGEKLDFKLKITSKEKIAKTLSALSNSQGGFIVVGMSDQKKIIGIDPEEERYMIEASNEEYCIPSASLIIDEIKVFHEKFPSTELESETSMLIVEVKKSPSTVIFCKNKIGEMKAYKRINDRTVAMSI
ncbi:MAG: ATP-binding protein [Algoriphagus sp.]|uniref:AlbA family DNA-binding domain-containing protein n=1 Tax=Algoriphagus sp. TaxID=1872435 RepID=UPI0027301723|nr:ATP-binding protein [Algoriphagus sp.]MDP2040743.1 ATP-binding protein [Algoriphagus sp.]MDP3473066.1 ATP-binding protein [Algoriphagus sp.]